MKMYTVLRYLLLVMLFVPLLLSCEKDSHEIVPSNHTTHPPVDKKISNPNINDTTNLSEEHTISKRPGGFAVSQLVNTANGRSANDAPTQVAFDLGSIKASQEFLFLLSNSGDVPVFDVSIEIDHPQFEVSPQRIDTLGANGISHNLLPLITVGVKHGIALNGVGEVDLLQPGAHTGIVTIQGKTLVSEDTVEVTAEVAMHIDAKVADINMYVNDALIALEHPDFGVVGPTRSNGYNIPVNSVVKIVNTGNIHILLSYVGIQYTGNGSEITFESRDIRLESGGSETFKAIQSNRIEITIDGDNTIMKHGKIVQETDGRGYITLIPD